MMMSVKRRYRHILHSVLLLSCLIFLLRCGDATPSSPTAPQPRTPNAPAVDHPAPIIPDSAGGTLIMTLGAQDPPTLDPALVGDTTSAFIVRQLFSGLVRLNNELMVEPDLAESWVLSDDERTYTFTLREHARFANGKPLTSADVRYTFERATDPTLAPTLPASTYLSDIVGVSDKLSGKADSISGLEIIDDRTIALTIDKPKSYFLSKLAHPTSFIVDKDAVNAGLVDWTEIPNGSGPFQIEQWERNQLLVLKRNLNFYRDIARLDRIRFLMGAAASNPMLLYEQGDIDVTEVPAHALARVRDENNPLSRELVRVPQLSLSYIGMNVSIPPFDDPYVREAFTLLLDRDRIAEVSLHGSVVAAAGILPPGIPGYREDIPPVAEDMERARQLLAQSRYGGASNLPVITAYGSGFTDTLRDVAAELGITIEVRAFQNFGEYLNALNDNQFPLFSMGWVADYPDPQNFLDVLFRSSSRENHMNYANPHVDSLLDAAAVEQDEQTRWQLYQEAEALILADAPIIPIHHDVSYTVIKPYVKGLVVTPMGILDMSTVELVR